MKPQEVKEILLKEWDPLNVDANPNIMDEYDTYLPKLLQLLKTGCTSDQIAAYLKEIEDSLGIILPPERRARAAKLLAER